MSEVMLAIVLLAISAVVVGGIISSSIKTAAFSRNFVIAQSLVSEGIEAVTNVRNTNWLQHPENHECWLIGSPSPSASCPASGPSSLSVTAGENYIVSFDEFTWSIAESASEMTFDPSDPEEAYHLYLDILGSTKFYNDSIAKSDAAEPSLFYRHVIFDSIALDQSEAVVTVTVAWKEGAKERSVARTFILYNF